VYKASVAHRRRLLQFEREYRTWVPFALLRNKAQALVPRINADWQLPTQTRSFVTPTRNVLS
jgi:hypothetical protein